MGPETPHYEPKVSMSTKMNKDSGKLPQIGQRKTQIP